MIKQIYHPALTITQIFSKFEKAVILSKLGVFFGFFPERQVHIFNMSATIVQNFRLIAYKLGEKLIIHTFWRGQTDGQTDDERTDGA